MALLAEQLVDEWLNRNGFFTLRGIKSGVHQIDLLGVRMSKGRLEGWHVECQVPAKCYFVHSTMALPMCLATRRRMQFQKTAQ
jgi:hypothetical protein